MGNPTNPHAALDALQRADPLWGISHVTQRMPGRRNRTVDMTQLRLVIQALAILPHAFEW